MHGYRVHVVGPVCFDVVFSGLSAPPRPGTEVKACFLGISPGGAANVAVALARLGLDVAVSAVFADDPFGRYLWSALCDEGVDLTYSVGTTGWSTPLTSSVAVWGERSMVTYAEPPPVDALSLLPAHYQADALVVSLAEVDQGGLARLHQVAPLVFADVPGEEGPLYWAELLERLASVDVFLPNAAEALAATGCDTLPEAATRLSARGPLVVVKDGAEGSLAVAPNSATVTREPAVPVAARDTTGAGDVFDAGFVYATLAGWSIRRRLRFANLCAAESVKLIGGSFAAPCWRDLGASYRGLADTHLRRSYRFLEAALADAPSRRDCRRSVPGIVLPPGALSGTAVTS